MSEFCKVVISESALTLVQVCIRVVYSRDIRASVGSTIKALSTYWPTVAIVENRSFEAPSSACVTVGHVNERAAAYVKRIALRVQ